MFHSLLFGYKYAFGVYYVQNLHMMGLDFNICEILPLGRQKRCRVRLHVSRLVHRCGCCVSVYLSCESVYVSVAHSCWLCLPTPGWHLTCHGSAACPLNNYLDHGTAVDICSRKIVFKKDFK